MNYNNNDILSDDELPNISLITPCYKRRHFLPLMICNLTQFDYPKEKLTFVLYQDGPEDMFDSKEHLEDIRKKLHPIKLILITNKHA